MKTDKKVDDYINKCNPEIAEDLRAIRKIILESSDEIAEGFSYDMPSYKACGKVLIYFASFAKHIGIYALPSANQHFKDELAKYKTSKGSIKFFHKEKLPLELISKIVRFRLMENCHKSIKN